MQTIQELASLRKRTKAAVSVWRFMYDAETDTYYAVGGEVLKVIPATSKSHLQAMYRNFQRYGYTPKLAKKRPYISDPWSSNLPSSLQKELELLSA